jgi:hypothetical protein
MMSLLQNPVGFETASDIFRFLKIRPPGGLKVVSAPGKF